MIISAVRLLVMWPITQSSKTRLHLKGSVLPHGKEKDAVYKNRVTCLHVPCDPGFKIDMATQTAVDTFLLRDVASGNAIEIKLSFDGDVAALEIRLSRRAAVTACDGVITLPVYIDGQSSVGTIMTVTAAPMSDPSQVFARGEFVLRAKITTPHDPMARVPRVRARSWKKEDKDFVVARQVHVEPPTRCLRSSAAFLDITSDEIDLFFHGVGE
jgi:hypothetical protein